MVACGCGMYVDTEKRVSKGFVAARWWSLHRVGDTHPGNLALRVSTVLIAFLDSMERH